MERDVAAYVQADYEKQKHRLSKIFQPIDNSKSLADIWASAGSVNFLGVAVQENPATMAWAVSSLLHILFYLLCSYFID